MTMIPAIIALVAIAIVPGDRVPARATSSRRLSGWRPSSRLGRVLRCAGAGPEPASAAACASRCTSSAIRDWALLGTLGWWGFNIAVLWACFKAFGHAPPIAVIIRPTSSACSANLLPLPGRDRRGGRRHDRRARSRSTSIPALAVVAVLVYRGFAFWLPTLPGAIAYLQLRRTVARWRRSGAREADAPAGTAYGTP